MLPTLRQLEYVVAVADQGQFVEAARHCGVSQPALSKQVREVEDLLGVRLFERTRPRVIVTAIGREVVARARRLLVGAHELVETAAQASSVRRGNVRLGVIPTVAPYGLPGLLAKLRGLYPDVSFAIQELQTDILLDRLRDGAVDIALLARSFDDHGLSGEDLVNEPFVFIAPVGHPMALDKAVAADEVSGAQLLLMEDGHCLRDQALDVCAMAGTQSRTVVSAASVSTLVRMVESGLGPTLLPATAITAEVREGSGVVARGFSTGSPGRILTLQWRATSPDAPWFRKVAALLRSHYADLEAGIPPIAGPQPVLKRIEP